LRVRPNPQLQDQPLCATFRHDLAMRTSANLLGHCEKQPQESRYREQYRLFGSVPEGRTRSISSSRFRSYSGGNLYRVSIPDNWQESGGGNSITYAPAGATGSVQGQQIFTHGVCWVSPTRREEVLETRQIPFVNSLLQSNDYSATVSLNRAIAPIARLIDTPRGVVILIAGGCSRRNLSRF